MITDSARTPAAAWAAFMAEVTVPNHCYCWGAGASEENPYFAYLALADELVVTGESMSMLAEACATDKPVFIFDLGDDGGPDGEAAAVKAWWRYAHNWRWKPLSHHLATRLAPARMRRDVGNIQRALITSGRAAWLGDDVVAKAVTTASPDKTELGRAAERVRALFTQ
jgi:hypothetical protein